MKTTILDKFKKEVWAEGEIYIRIKVRPGAAQTAPKAIMADGTIKIDITAPAQKNKANKELKRFLSKEFNTKEENVIIISGAASRLKLVKILKN